MIVRRFHAVARVFNPAPFIHDELVLIAPSIRRLYFRNPKPFWISSQRKRLTPTIKIAGQGNALRLIVVLNENDVTV
jgi:hypothetical protein